MHRSHLPGPLAEHLPLVCTKICVRNTTLHNYLIPSAISYFLFPALEHFSHRCIAAIFFFLSFP